MASDDDPYEYQTGFGNTFESEVLPGTLPVGRNNPREVPYGLYTEQISGSLFTAPRAQNKRTWLYRMRPRAVQNRAEHKSILRYCGCKGDPSQFLNLHQPLRWKPVEVSPAPSSFPRGLFRMTWNEHVSVYQYSFQDTDSCTAMVNTEADFLVVPQDGPLDVCTEVGRLSVSPGECIVMPQNICFCIHGSGRGYVLESKQPFELPELGPLGSNGLANARDFQYPDAWCEVTKEEYNQDWTMIMKKREQLFESKLDASPFDVVAWHGNHLPYKYNLYKFCAVGSVTYDHLDPSIYTVLTTGTADFLAFVPRRSSCDDGTFRPPWFHVNVASEFMGLIEGSYDAKQDFVPGGASLHDTGVPHGPDAATYDKAIANECSTELKGLAIMFEATSSMLVSPHAEFPDEEFPWERDFDYAECWKGLEEKFTGWEELKNLYEEE